MPFTRQQIVRAAEIANSAYISPTDRRENAQAILSDFGDEQVISIAGTQIKDVQDVIEDLDPFCVLRKGIGHIGDGFADYFDTVCAMLDGKVLADRRPKIVVGHSLGGSGAILYAKHLKNHGIEVRGISFCCPKIGREDFFNGYDVDTVNIIHGCDRIPGLPWWLHRPGKDLFIGTDGKEYASQPSAGLNPFKRFRTLADHKQDDVVVSLKKWAERAP